MSKRMTADELTGRATEARRDDILRDAEDAQILFLTRNDF